MARWPAADGVIELPDGRRISGRGLRSDPSRAGVLPEYGLYLTGRRPPAQRWRTAWIPWPDFGLPRSRPAVLALLRDAHEQALDTRVELACGGGNGRTGTALAILAVLSGVDPDDAVAWVRRHYRPRAVETPWQRGWVRRAALPPGAD
jgi:protein-tyrosine phosphatase